MKRREFISLLGGAVAWPIAARAQQTERVRRLGVLMHTAADDPQATALVAGLVHRLQELGWTSGNFQIDYRWAEATAQLYRKYAAELIALAPDVVLASNTTAVRAVLELSRSIPIVFTEVTDPVSGGLVMSLARPGGNVTGFTLREFGLAAKSLELLKHMSPRTVRLAVLRDATTTGGAGQLGAIQAAAPSFGIEFTPIDLHDEEQIERDVDVFSQQPNGAFIVTTSARAVLHRKLIIHLASKHRLPAIYPSDSYTSAGGLFSYGPDEIENWSHAAEYIHRILNGEKPADLPVQAPTKYELVINLKTARALGLEVPATLLARADRVIE